MVYCRICGNELPPEAEYCPKCGTAVMAEGAPAARAEPAAVASGVYLAFWGERFVAWLIDVTILGAIVLAIGLLAWWFAGQPFTWTPGWPSWLPFFSYGVGSVIYFLYWTFMEGASGQSIGKMVMRIKVTRLDGKPASFEQAAVESVGKAFLLPLDLILGWVLYPRRRQRIFHYISGTIVVRQ